MKKIIVSVFALAAVAFGVNAAENTQTASGAGHADIVKAIAIAPQAGSNGVAAGVLEFGRVAIGSAATSVTIDADSDPNRSAATGATLVGTLASAAKFKITGTKDYTFALTYPSTLAIGTMSANLVSNFESSKSSVSIAENGTDVYIGGTLNILENTAAQVITNAAFSVTVTYN